MASGAQAVRLMLMLVLVLLVVAAQSRFLGHPLHATASKRGQDCRRRRLRAHAHAHACVGHVVYYLVAEGDHLVVGEGAWQRGRR